MQMTQLLIQISETAENTPGSVRTVFVGCGDQQGECSTLILLMIVTLTLEMLISCAGLQP